MVANSRQGTMQRHHLWLVAFQRLVDASIVVALLPLICFIFQENFGQKYQVITILGGTFSWIAMGLVDAYREWRGASLWQEIKVLLLGWLLVMTSLIVIAWITEYRSSDSRNILMIWFTAAPFFIILIHTIERLFLHMMRKHGRNTRRVVIIGAGRLGTQLAQRIQQSDWMGMKLVGFFDDDTSKLGQKINGLTILGNIDDAYEYIKSQNIDQVYFALPMHAEYRIRKSFDQLQDTTASLYLIPDLFIFELLGAREQDIAGMPAFALCETPLTGAFGLLKRLEDIVLASAILLFIWPFLLLIMVIIKLTSPGPAIFKQARYGLNGKPITVYKFRSMSVCDNDANNIKQASKNDARITPFGAFLRRTSLDELPQFFNVLQGRMSVVGPRPHAVAHNEQYRKLIKGYMWRHKVKPGITGWAQINGWRGETDTLNKMEKRVEYDLDYIQKWSILFDIKIVLLTIVKGFTNKNAY